MIVPAEILTIRQDLNLEQGASANFLVIRLPTGRVIQALVDDDVVKEIISIVANGEAPAPVMPVAPAVYDRPPPTRLVQEQLEDGTSIAVFGGTGESGGQMPHEPPPIAHMEDAPYEPEPEQEVRPRPAMRQQTQRAPKVQADAKGNPIVVARDGVDPGEYIGNEEEPGEAASI